MTKSVRIFWRLFFGSIGFFLILVLLISLGVFGKMPSIAQLENPSMIESSEILAADGTLMGKYYTEKGNRSVVQYNEISKNVINALIATEDKRFYEHSGIDGKGVLRAVVFFGRAGGGSTITQQLALNLFNERSENPLVRIIQKLQEWIIAVKLERNFTKEEILALYLNAVSYSENVYGIRNASKTFFSKEPDRLNVQEAAVLIGMVNGPSIFNPKVHPENALKRRNTVLSKMVTKSYLTEEEGRRLKALPIVLNFKKINENSGLAPYFRDVIKDDLRKWCKNHINPATGEPYNINEDGLKIYTTINPRMQLYAEEAVTRNLPALQKVMNGQPAIKSGKAWKGHENILLSQMKNSDRWKNGVKEKLSEVAIRASFNMKVPMRVFAWNANRSKDTIMTPLDSIKYHRQMMQTAFMVMDPMTGEVKAWVGGIDFKTYKYDHVNLKTKRQVGSTIKPFLYCQAVEEAGFTPETECEQTRQYFKGFGWVPAKETSREGTRSMASGLAYSINEVSAYLMKEITPPRFVDFLKRINIQTPVEPYPSIALGSCELSMFETLWGYSMFPNGGYSTKPIYISRIEDRNGNLLESFTTTSNQVISENTAYTMVKMMQGVVDIGTAAGLRERLGAAEMSGKTGTTNDNSDAWFIGYTPQLLAGTWVGCDDRFIRLSESTMGMGGQAARPIYEYFFRKVYADKTLGIEREAIFLQPEGMKQLPPVMMDEGPVEDGDELQKGSLYEVDPNAVKVPVESDMKFEQEKKKEEAAANGKKADNQSANDDDNNGKKKERKGFLRKLFGKGRRHEDNNNQ